jgi:hypothetical protein
MERHGHLQLDTEVRRRLLAMSAATMGRVLRPVQETGKQGRRRSHLNTPLRKRMAVLTDVASGWTEAAALVVREQTLITLTVRRFGESCRSRCSGLTWTTIALHQPKRLWTTTSCRSRERDYSRTIATCSGPVEMVAFEASRSRSISRQCGPLRVVITGPHRFPGDGAVCLG